MKKILFVTAHRKDRAPNQRYRFEQYFSYLEQKGFECTLAPLILTQEEDKLFYSSGNYLKKIPLGMKMGVRRLMDTVKARRYDIIFIAREAFITGSIFFEQLFAWSGTKIVFDFDDAIWMNVISSNNRFFSWLKDNSKTGKIVRLADVVFAGNEYLAAYARRQNKNVVIIPTTINTEAYQPSYSISKEKIIIGWTGSASTLEHFQFAIPALKLLKEKFGEKIGIKVIGDGEYRNAELNVIGVPWKSETEVQDLRDIDIGIMPLPDNEWTRGKCGLKGLQYMAMEIPTIMSPVGVNKEIIEDGVNGYLANDNQEWVDRISFLIENPTLRLSVGKKGRQTVIEKYSVLSQRQNYLNQFVSLLGQ